MDLRTLYDRTSASAPLISKQHRSAARALRDRVSNVVVGVVFVVIAGVVLGLMAYFAANPTMPPECVALYRDARSAADTAMADRVIVRNHRKSPLSCGAIRMSRRDRKSTRLNSSHLVISYAVFCLKKR